MSAPLTSRQARQIKTRRQLVHAARSVFAEVGFHAATLDSIAQRAGFSKGAVYSNFENKATLFLAVMDENIAAVSSPQTLPEASSAIEDPRLEGAVRGFALATLEFIATAARDAHLSAETGKRISLLIEGYAELAEGNGAQEGGLSRRQLGALVAALDQGSAMLSLAGLDLIEPLVLEAGMRRLMGLDPPGLDESDRRESAGGQPHLHYREVRQRIARQAHGWLED